MAAMIARLSMMALLAPTLASAAEVAPITTTPMSCTGQTDRTTPIPAPKKGRLTLCAVDLGSNTAKLQVVSMDRGKPLSFKDERQCRARLGFGAMVFDSTTGDRKALPASETAKLVEVVKEFQRICALDKGEMLGAEATQWARDALNVDDVRKSVKAATGLDFEVLTAEWEGHFGYVAATRNTPGRFALDPGSNSFQIAWWPQGAKVARTVSVPLGYVRGSRAYYPADAKDTFDAARAKHADDIRKRLDEALGALKPPSSLSELKAAVAKGALSPEMFVMGQDGALHLVVRGQLRDREGRWITAAAPYEAAVSAEPRLSNERFGEILAQVKPEEVSRFLGEVAKPADFDVLRSEPVRSLYGEKALSNAVLLDVLARELGIQTIVLVPQEMPAGYILFRLALGA
jgi:hypothetical protein